MVMQQKSDIFLKKVECSGIIERKWVPQSKRTTQDPGNKKWVRAESIFNGHVIGERTLSNGMAEYDPECISYWPNNHFKAYIVVYDIHRKPVHVLPEDVKIIE